MSTLIDTIFDTNKKMPEGYEKVEKLKLGCTSSYSPIMGLSAIYTYASVLSGFIAYEKIKEGVLVGGFGLDDNQRYIAEIKTDFGIECAMYNSSTGSFMLSIFSEEGEMKEYKPENENNAILFLVLMESILSDSEANDLYCEMQQCFSNPSFIENWEKFSSDLAKLCDNIRCRMVQKGEIFSIHIELDQKINVIPIDAIKRGVYKIEAAEGILSVFSGKGEIKTTISSNWNSQNFNGAFSFSKKKCKLPVAKINDKYKIPEIVVDICKDIKESTNFEPKTRNILLVGPSGSGKTESAVAIAAGCGLPYLTYTCHPNTDAFDIIGQFVPNDDSDGVVGSDPITIKRWMQNNGLPTMQELTSDPKKAYKKITGKRAPANLSLEMIVEKTMETIFSLIYENENKRKKEFHFVMSEIMEAILNGYLVEIQEPTVITNEGTLIALNSVMVGGYITLSTGRRIYRHPDSVVVYTTNTPEYIGYGIFSNSVLSRCDQAYEFNTPDIEEMIQRAIAKTGYNDTKQLRKMAMLIHDISHHMKDKNIKDGVCGFREFINWITKYRINGDMYESCLPTVVNKTTFNLDFRKEIIDIVEERLL